MDSKNNWRNSLTFRLFLCFITILWTVTILYLLLIHNFNLEISAKNMVLLVGFIFIIATIAGALIIWKLGNQIDQLISYTKDISTSEDNVEIPSSISSDPLLSVAKVIKEEHMKAIAYRDQREKEEKVAIEREKESLMLKQSIANSLNHEIKTPIGIIQGYIDTLIEHNEEVPPTTRKQFLQKCLDNTIRLQNMVYNITVISRLDSSRESILLDDIDLIVTLNSVIEDLSVILQNARFRVINNLPESYIVHSNTTMLYNIFSNLIKNAISYSGGDTITIELTSDGLISFRDNGKGIANDKLPFIFDRFYRVEEDKKKNLTGSGLGLSIVKDSVKLHGGNITVRNHPNGGLQFIFSL